MDFQPEVNVLPVGEKYRPMYKLRPTDRWSLVLRGNKPVECDTSYGARKVAQELIDAIMNPTHVIEDEPAPFGSVEDWRKERDEQVIAERERVFGSLPLNVVRDCKGNQVAVTRRRVRA
jgi:hypothetical protein